MKRLIFLLLILTLYTIPLYAQKKGEETKDVESKEFSFDIDKIVVFINFIDADLKTPLKANVQILDKKGTQLVNKTGLLIKSRLPINQVYTFKVSCSKYKDSTFKFKVKRFKEYETTKTVKMYPVKVPVLVTLGDANNEDIKPENMRLNVKSQKTFENISFKRKGDSNTFVAYLRKGATYDLELRDPNNSFFHTQQITTSNTNNIKIPNSIFEKSKKTQTVVVEKIVEVPAKKEDDEVAKDNKEALTKENQAETEKVDTVVKEIVKDNKEIDPIDRETNSYQEMLVNTNEQLEKDGNDLIKKREKMQKKLEELKDYVENNELSQGQKDTINNYIKAMKEKMTLYDKLYSEIRRKNLTTAGEIQSRLGFRESFWKRFWYIIVIFIVIIAVMFVFMVIQYFIARNRRKQRDKLQELNNQIEEEKAKSDNLLLNILPVSIANELKSNGSAKMRSYERVSILFTDFKGFTKIASKMKPDKLIQELNDCFTAFDAIISGYNMEKIKTIGDAYMCAGGIPEANLLNPIDSVLAGLQMQAFMVRRREEKLSEGDDYWKCRLGINTGEIRAGVIGTSKFAYDIWGDAVNIASRMESGGEVNKVNISEHTYEYIKEFFDCTDRGEIEVKNGLVLKMYFVDRIKPELSSDERGLKPNQKFDILKKEIYPDLVK